MEHSIPGASGTKLINPDSFKIDPVTFAPSKFLLFVQEHSLNSSDDV
jgi:hypothetical protein